MGKLEWIISIEDRAWSEALEERILELGFVEYTQGKDSSDYGFEGEGNPVKAAKILRDEFPGFNWTRHMDENYVIWSTNTKKEKDDAEKKT